MYRIESKIDVNSKEFIKNKTEFLKILDEYKSRLKSVKSRDDSKPVIRHKKRGKLLARERIDLLLDPNTPFLELSALAACDAYDGQFPSAGIITGIGVGSGKRNSDHSQ